MPRLVAAMACVLLAVSAAPAQAKKKPSQGRLGPVMTIKSDSPTVAAPGTTSATATCPAGTQALGGGWTAPFGGGATVVVYESYRSAPSAWTVTGFVSSGSGALTAFGYCRTSNRSISDLTSTTTLPAGPEQMAATSVRCPAGSRLVSGGFQSTRVGNGVGAPRELFVDTPGLWSVLVESFGGAGAKQITAHAYCVPKLRTPSLVNTPVSSSFLANGAGLTASSFPCATPKKRKQVKGKKKKKIRPQRMSSGGFSSGAIAAGTPFPVFTENRLDGATWRASAVNAGASGPVTITALGICS